ncbi:MAG: LacI family DNA-binding transcriptional regulator, partial [Cetobacterium sp.]
MLKQEDIAKLANVSRTTVSRVLNKDINVKEETRIKIEKIISE